MPKQLSETSAFRHLGTRLDTEEHVSNLRVALRVSFMHAA